MKRKDVVQWCRQQALSLPVDTYPVEHKFWPRAHFNEDGEPLVGYWQQHEVNHGRRLKRCYDIGGWPLIEKYFNHYGMHLNRDI